MARNPTPWDFAHSRLLSYCRLMWSGFRVSAHIRYVAAALERVERGEIKRLIITLPPRHCKSLLTTENFAAWYLGRNPDHQLITGTYGQRLANKWGRKVRNHIASPKFRQVFPGVRLATDSSANDQFATNKGGYYIATSSRGMGTGAGANLFLIDDPTKDRKEADSRPIQENIQDWYTDVVTTRLMPGGAVIILMTRWTDADLAGFVLREHKHEGWTIINLPALAEDDDPLGRAVGEPLWPEQFSLQELMGKKATLPPRSWAALYQQRPVPQEGLIVKPEYFTSTRYDNPPLSFHRLIISVDTARKAEEWNDPTVWSVWAETDKGYFLLYVLRERVTYPRLKGTTVSLAEKWRPDLVIIEDSANGNALEQDLRATTNIPVRLVGTDGMDKVSRMDACTDLMEGGRVWLPQSAEWLPEYERELFQFPAVEHDDQADSTSQALRWFKSKLYAPIAYEGVSKNSSKDDFDEEW